MVIFVLVGTHTASEDRRRCRDDCDPQLVAALAGAAIGLESAQSQILNTTSPSHPSRAATTARFGGLLAFYRGSLDPRNWDLIQPFK
jgi:Tfp pilus assembly protein PilX